MICHLLIVFVTRQHFQGRSLSFISLRCLHTGSQDIRMKVWECKFDERHFNEQDYGDGFVLGNAELRWKPVHFNLFKRKVTWELTFFMTLEWSPRKIDLPDNLRTTFANNMKGYNFEDFFDPGEKNCTIVQG